MNVISSNHRVLPGELRVTDRKVDINASLFTFLLVPHKLLPGPERLDNSVDEQLNVLPVQYFSQQTQLETPVFTLTK